MICERCRNEIADNAIICPVCGTHKVLVSQQKAGDDQAYPHKYEYYQQGNSREYQSSYTPPPPESNQQGYQEGYAPQQTYGFVPPPYSAHQGYAPNINVTVINSAKNEGALIAEILLSLVGIFGVGWLIAGETTVGIILLLCSIFLYWPIIFFITLFTAGIGLICLSPLVIAFIIINAVLLNNVLKRKAVPFVFVQQPPMQMPPQS